MTHAFTSQGAQLQRGNGATPTETFSLIVEIHTITGPTEKGNPIDVTNLDSLAKEFIAGIVDPGEIKISGNFIPNNSTLQAVRADFVNGVSRHFRLVFADNVTTPTTVTFTAVVTEFAVKGSVNKQVEVDIGLKISGVVTYSYNSSSTVP